MLPRRPPFLVWYDDNPKLSITRKIEEAMAAYSRRFNGVRPTLILVNEEEMTDVAGVQVRSAPTVRRNTYWVGQVEGLEETPRPAGT